MDQVSDGVFSESATSLINNLMQHDVRFSLSDLELLYPGFKEDCHKLCATYIYQFFFSEVNCPENFIISRENLKKRLGIIPQYRRLYDYLITFLIDQGLVLQKNSDDLVFVERKLHGIDLLTLMITYPMFHGTLSLLDHCARCYGDVLTGKKYALSVLFPEGKTTFLDDTLSHDANVYSEIPTLTDLLVEVIVHLNKIKPIRILEIGGGRGLITKHLLRKLNGEYFYHFTDVSKRFLIDMQQYAIEQHIPEKQFSVGHFDVAKRSNIQDIALHSYDVILGLDVLHVTPDLLWSIDNLRTLLKKEGLLFLLETTKSYAWQNMTMGLAHGWWDFADQWRAKTPVIDLSQWEKVFSASTMQLLKAYTLGNRNSDAALLLAR